MTQRHAIRTIELPDAENYVLAVISDTHGKPHPNLFPSLEHYRPSLILHAGDVGNLDLITELEAYGQTIYVRGNVDPAGLIWPDSVTLHTNMNGKAQMTVLLLHIAVARFRLMKCANDLLSKYPSSIVIFGHSHIPFLGKDGKIYLFNPGSAGPSRMGLPVTMGLIEISSGQLRFKHIDLRTGEQWKPVQ